MKTIFIGQDYLKIQGATTFVEMTDCYTRYSHNPIKSVLKSFTWSVNQEIGIRVRKKQHGLSFFLQFKRPKTSTMCTPVPPGTRYLCPANTQSSSRTAVVYSNRLFQLSTTFSLGYLIPDSDSLNPMLTSYTATLFD